MAPSPTAAATRWTEPLRTSPAANTPERLVSSSAGDRLAPSRPSSVTADAASWPVSTYPPSSSATRSSSHSVCGSAPMNTNNALASMRRRSRLSMSSMTSASSASSPISSLTSECRQPRSPDFDDPVGEVPRHRLAEILLADDQGQPRDVLGQEQRGLPGRVATPHGDHRIVAAQLSLRHAWPRSRRWPAPTPRVGPPAASDSRTPLAMTTARPMTEPPRAAHAERPVKRLKPTASPGSMICAPNFSAWIVARSASSAPEMPAGKPR